ncbi:MAG: hypothetical protein DRO88_13890 [Promethearchaeia archaeon]|nr:MAG: hypothetical protein DRO88_13890 [Candidatus Lokiarchaeia archaeon]
MLKAVVLTKIAQFKALTYPDRDLTREILQILGIYDIVDLEFSLNKVPPQERLAAIKMVEKHLDDLLSGDEKKWAEAKDNLKQFYFQIDEMDEEGYL